MLGIDLAGGAFIFLLFIVTFTIAVAYALYGRRGSAITQQPYGKIYGSAPGAMRSSETRPRGRDREVVAWTHGTR
jgi:hypothetical protein